MRCGDLERYLEAFLDGRLGRSRAAVLRRHLALCAACQVRVERLRQFERETQRRFRSPEQPGSVWEGLELDLVGSNGVAGGGRLLAAPRGLPSLGGEAPPERQVSRRAAGLPLVAAHVSGRGTASRLAGALLVAVALTAAYQIAQRGFGPQTSSSAAQAYLAYRRDQAVPMLSSGDARQVADWLAAEFGHPVPLPPVPNGYGLVGATHMNLTGGTTGVLVYAQAADAEAAPVMLFVSPDTDGADDRATPPDTIRFTGLQQVQWVADDLRYTAVGPFPEDQLLRFQR